MRSIKKNTFR